MIPELLKSKSTVIAFDFVHQGRSLDEFVRENHLSLHTLTRPILPPLLGERVFWAGRPPLLRETPAEDQADTIEELLTKLGVAGPVHVVGLSYGGGVALQFAANYPERISSVSLLAPYVKPLAAQDELIRLLISHYHRMFPMAVINEDELYDYFLRILVISSYHFSEPTILKWGAWQPFAASELIRGIRKLDAEGLAERLPKESLHLVIAGMDPYIPETTLMEFWNSVPKSARGSLLKIVGVEHKINESVGPFIAGWTNAIVLGNPMIRYGREFIGHPVKGEAKSREGGALVNLPATPICENLLRPGHPNSPNLPVDRIVRYPGEDFMDRFIPSELRNRYRRVADMFLGL